MDLRERVLTSIAESSREEKLIIAMITGAFDALIARQELKEKENELLEILCAISSAL